MGGSASKSKSYDERLLVEKIQSNWTKTCGLYSRGEHSMAVIRAATTVELAANLVVLEEFEKKSNLPPEFVDHLMKWANGLHGKLTKLILPICKGTNKEQKFKSIQSKVSDINEQRNSIAHRGEFKTKKTSSRVIKEAQQVIQVMVKVYDSTFDVQLPDEETDNENP